jgi:hypothetical protein
METFLELTWQTQVILVSGYIGYVVAYSGRRSSHKAIDYAAIPLCFGLIGLLGFSQTLLKIPVGNEYRDVIASLVALFSSVVVALVWRAKLASLVRQFLRFLKADQDDGFPTAWQTITQEPGLNYSQVFVTLKSGRCLESYQLAPYNSLPNGPVVLGPDGSIALYVNAITEKGERREISTISDYDGHRITYIPAEQIVEVDFRRSSE